ncbi:unnamed protein product [Arctogadus glacialis]
MWSWGHREFIGELQYLQMVCLLRESHMWRSLQHILLHGLRGGIGVSVYTLNNDKLWRGPDQHHVRLSRCRHWAVRDRTSRRGILGD